MRFIKSPMGTVFAVITVCLIITLLFEACRKLDSRPPVATTGIDPVEKFFKVSPAAHPTVKRIAETIKKQDDQFHFIGKFITDQGYLIWDKARIFPSSRGGQARLGGGGGGGDTSWILPIVKENTEKVSGFLACLPKGGDTVLFRLFDATTYPYHFGDTDSSGIEARELALITMVLERDVFGHNLFKIIDTALLDDDHGNPVRYIKLEEQHQSRLVLLGTWYVCYTVWVTDNEGQMVGCPPGDETCNGGQSELICETFDVWGFDDLDEGHGGGGGEGGWGTGGGGDINGGWINPCRAIETIPGTYTGTSCESGGPLGWISYDFGEDEFDPTQFDEVRIDPILRDSFPCIASLIEDTLYNINRLVQIGMHDIFTVNQYNHTYFKLDWNIPCNGPISGTTDSAGSFYQDAAQQLHWVDTIRLNPCWLRKASKEAIVTTIIHETLHAYINWCVYQYRRFGNSGPVDSFYLQEHFPLHWEYIIGRPYQHENTHELMARNYVRYMASVIFTHGNQNSPAELRRWVAKMLAAGGFQHTSAWGTANDLMDTCSIHNVNYWGDHHHNYSNPFGYTAGGPCNTTYYDFRDSLQMLRADSCQ